MWTFVKSAARPTDYPHWDAPLPVEIAFVGRSNVGKSSLINALTKQRALARVSHTPGRTQLVNFFRNEAHVLVDLPGYGYARLSHGARAEVGQIVHHYLAKSTFLKHVFVLIDSRRGLLEIDQVFINEQLSAKSYSWSLVFTKSDKLTQTLFNRVERQAKALGVPYLFVASKTKFNIDELRSLLFTF